MVATLQLVLEVTFQSGLKSLIHTYQHSIRYLRLVNWIQNVLSEPILISLKKVQHHQKLST